MEQNSLVPEEAKKQGSSVGLRWLSALILMPVILLFVWLGGWATFVAIVVIVGVGTWEMHHMLLNAGFRPLIWISFGLSILFVLAAMLPQQRLLVLEVGMGAALLITFPCLFLRKRLDGALVDWALTLAVALYLGWPMSLFLLLRGNQMALLLPASGAWLFLPPGMWWLLVTLLGVWSFDGSAFFAGRYFGRHKLAPAISPGKTWEGVVGGSIICVVACLLLTVVPLGIPWYLAIVLGLFISFAAVSGDLAESLIKRQTHVKDSGQIVPGHGGILDRIDSVLFAIIVVYIFVQILAK